MPAKSVMRGVTVGASLLVVLVLLACSGSTPQTPPRPSPTPSTRSPVKPSPPGKPGPKPDKPSDKPTPKPPDQPAKPVVVSAQELAQAIQDDTTAAYKKYRPLPLAVEGVVSKIQSYKGETKVVLFTPTVKDKKTGKSVEFTVFFSLAKAIPAGEEAKAGFVVGKKATIRGKMGAAGNGQATLYKCEIVKE